MPKQAVRAYTIRASVAGAFAEELKALADSRGQTLADITRHALADWLEIARARQQATVYVTEVRLPQHANTPPQKPVEPLPPNDLTKARAKRLTIWPNNSPLAT